MFIVVLRFAGDRGRTAQFMDSHRAWIERGIDDGVFLLVGSLQPDHGGVIFAHNTSRSDLESRVDDDPFVDADVVTAEILEVAPANADERLAFLLR